MLKVRRSFIIHRIQLAKVGVEPTESRGSGHHVLMVARRFASLRTRLYCQLQAPVSSRAGQPYESRLGTCRACNAMTKGRVELPSHVARLSESRVFTSFTTWSQ